MELLIISHLTPIFNLIPLLTLLVSAVGKLVKEKKLFFCGRIAGWGRGPFLKIF